MGFLPGIEHGICIAHFQRPAHARLYRRRISRWPGGGSCRLLWIGIKSRPFVISAMQFDETTPARRCLLQSWRGVRAAYPMTRIVSGGRFGPAKGQFITRSQIHGWRTDSRVRILYAQPRSRPRRMVRGADRRWAKRISAATRFGARSMIRDLAWRVAGAEGD
jgi:hypothetical protein